MKKVFDRKRISAKGACVFIVTAIKHSALISLIAITVACGGGGSEGTKPPASSASSSSVPPTNPNPNPVDPAPLKVLSLGVPSAYPVVIPPSGSLAQVTFRSIISGNAHPPEFLWLDEIDLEGHLIAEGVAKLRDDGEGADSHLGDRVYTGTLMAGNTISTAKYYRVRTLYENQIIESGAAHFWVSGCPVNARPSNIEKAVLDSRTASYIFSNEVMIKVKENIAPDLVVLNEAAEEVNGRVVGCIPALNEYLLEIDGNSTAEGVYTAIDVLELNAIVERASPNARVITLPQEEQLACEGIECQWYLERIRAPEAWHLMGGGDKEFSVAVIDFGVDCNHPELRCDASRSYEDPIDHGTGVASLIGARSDNGTGIQGVAWNTGIYPHSFISASGSQYKMSELITASMGEEQVRVINISAATSIDTNGQIRDAICTAIDSGRLVVAAAGNAQMTKNCRLEEVFPAKYNTSGACANGADLKSGLLVVGATDVDNNLAEWSGQCSNLSYVDLFAPGKDVYAANAAGGYSNKSGTSYAAPLVSGAAAILWAANPELSVTEIHNILLTSGATLGDSNNPRSGSDDNRVSNKPLLDVYKALGGPDVLNDVMPDIEPDEFSFPAKTAVPVASISISDAVLISGVDYATPINITDGHYSIADGPFTSAAGFIKNGQSVRIRLVSAGQPDTRSDAIVTIGGVSAVYSVTTVDESPTATSFYFTPRKNVALTEVIISDEVILSGINNNTPISIEGGDYAVNDGAFTSVSGTVNASDSLRIRLTAAATHATLTEALVTIGATTAAFGVTTENHDAIPAAFQLAQQSDADLNTFYFSNAITVTDINADAVISISGGEYAIDGGDFVNNAGTITNGQSVQVRLLSASTPQATSYSTLAIGGISDTFKLTTLTADSTPDAFSLIDQSDVAVGTEVTSNTISVTGINVPVPVSVINGSYRINNGSFTTEPGFVSNGDTVSLRLFASTAIATTVSATLTISGVSDTFNVSTPGASLPATFNFVDQTNVVRATSIESNAISITGLNSAVTVSVVGGEYAIDGGDFTSVAGTISNNQSLQLRVLSSGNFGAAVSATINVGGVTDTFTVTTLAADVTPNSFSFTDQTNVAVVTQVISNTIIVSGINTSVPISISSGAYRINSGSFTSVAGVVNNGDTVEVRLTSSSTVGSTVSATLTIGGISDTFSVATHPADTVPEAFVFVAQTGVALNAQVESNSITVAGINTLVPISVLGGQYRINGGNYTAVAGFVNEGDLVQIRASASPTHATEINASLSVGGVTGTFSVTTLEADTTPNPFVFESQTNAPLSTLVESNAITVEGINTGVPIGVVNGEYRINAGAYTSANGTVNSGDVVIVRLTSAATSATSHLATLTIGGAIGTFTVSTLASSTTPDPFSFSPQTGVDLNTEVLSNTIVVSGINAPASISISNGSYRINGGEFTSAAGTVNNGDSVTLRLISSPTVSSTSSATLTIGNVSGSFNVTTLVQAPQAIVFSDAEPRILLIGDVKSNSANGPGTGMVTYTSSNNTVATVDAIGQVQTHAAGTAVITATKAADLEYLASSANYTVSVVNSLTENPTSVGLVAWIGREDTEVSFPAGASGMEFFRSTNANCNWASYASCANGQLNYLNGMQINDTATNLNRAGHYLLKHNARQVAITATADHFSARSGHEVAVYDDKFWLMGGYSTVTSSVSHNDLWSSIDGVNWTLQIAELPFSTVSGFQLISFSGKLWFIGGVQNGMQIWSTSDGVNWAQHVTNLSAASPWGFKVVVYNSELWMVGGDNNKEIWSSGDGISWTLRNANVAFTPRAEHQVLVFNGKLWMIGGRRSSAYTDVGEVWSSSDGVSWSQEIIPDFSYFLIRHGHQIVVHNNKLWLFGGSSNPFNSSATHKNDVWSSADGINWTLEAAAAEFSPRLRHRVLVKQNKLWLIGGERGSSLSTIYENDIWSSANGVAWVQQSNSNIMYAREGHQVVEHNDKLWLIGGNIPGRGYQNDVWASSDGMNWERKTAAAAFSGRTSHQVVSFNNRLWVIGGSRGGTTRLADVWSSTDGVSWVRHIASGMFSARMGHQVVVHNNQMWLLGGQEEAALLRDVWSSSDGDVWVRQTAAAGFSTRFVHEAVSYNNQLWVIGGLNASGSHLNDVWSSLDGISWTRHTAAPFSVRHSHQLVVYQNALWLTGGTSRVGSDTWLNNDIWTSTDGVTWVQRSLAADFPPVRDHQVVLYDNKLWLIGGLFTTELGDIREDTVWSSTDGIEWRKGYRGVFQLSQ